MEPSRLTTATVAARIPYANAAPFYTLWADAPFAVRNLSPRDLGREAEAGGVDLGLMATGDFLRLRDRFELLAPMGVAARGPVQSVLLFSRRPASALAGALISVTPETSTSIRLLKLLLNVKRGLPGVRFVRGLEPAQADALLLIGDNAMRTRNRPPDGFVHTLDLGDDWLDWTGLPFVYAVWAGWPDALDPEQVCALREARACGEREVAQIAREVGAGNAGLECRTLRYLRDTLRYGLGDREIAGLERFHTLAVELGSAPAARALRFYV